MKDHDFRRIQFGRCGETMVTRERDAPSPDSILTSDPGTHEHCGGRVEMRKISDSMSALICKACFVKFPIPSTIRTYGELADYMNSEPVLYGLGIIAIVEK